MAISEQVEQMERDDLEDFAVNLYEGLEDRISTLEENDEELEERVRDVETEIDARPKLRMDGNEVKDIAVGDKTKGNYVPLGLFVSRNHNSIDELDDRTFALERGEVDVSDIIDGTGTEDELPIQRATDERKKDIHDFSANKYRATYVWPKFNKRSKPDGSKRTLYSWQVKQILDDNDLDTNPATVRRTMEFVAKLTSKKSKKERDPKDPDNLVVFNDDGAENTLVADKDEWEEFFSNQIDASLNGTPSVEGGDEGATADDATDNVAEDVVGEEDALMAASVVTSSDDDDVTDEAGIEVPR